MSRQLAQQALNEALAISHELVRVAGQGDGRQAQLLNSRRACLLREFLDGAQPVVGEDLHTLEQISKLNRIAIEDLEMCKKATLRMIETVGKGKQAVRAYGQNKRKL